MCKPRVVIGTTSDIKLVAVREVSRLYLSIAPEEILGVKTDSGVHEQPVGLQEIYTGALNRARNAQQACREAELAIGIENGIVDISGQGTLWIDFAVVIGLRQDGKQFTATSAGLEFPLWAVEVARKKGFEANTVAEVMHEANNQICSTNPHSFLTNNVASRYKLLVEALTVLVAQIRAQEGNDERIVPRPASGASGLNQQSG